MQNLEKSEQECRCPHCGAKLNGRWENLSKGLVENLIRLREQVLRSRENKVHLMKDLSLSHSQYTNFQKLRFHGLIAHYKNPVTKLEETGYWLLTKRGNQFCKNQISIPKKVLIFRNSIKERGVNLVDAVTVLKQKSNEPYWYQKDDYETQIVFLDILDADEIKIDKNGQGKLF
jgi:hypothetical protein